MWIQIRRPLPFLILSHKKFDSKNVPEPDCQSLWQIWCESVQNCGVIAVWLILKWRLRPSSIFALYVFWQCNWLREPFFGTCIKFGVYIGNVGPIAAKNVIYSVALTAILDFMGNQFCHWNQFWGLIFSVCVKYVWIHSKMTELLPFNWLQNLGRRHVGFFALCEFWR